MGSGGPCENGFLEAGSVLEAMAFKMVGVECEKSPKLDWTKSSRRPDASQPLSRHVSNMPREAPRVDKSARPGCLNASASCGMADPRGHRERD